MRKEPRYTAQIRAILRLNRLKPEAHAAILAMNGTGNARRRLMDMGLTRGAVVTVLALAPFNDPMIISARGCVMAIRRAQAAMITVSPLRAQNKKDG